MMLNIKQANTYTWIPFNFTISSYPIPFKVNVVFYKEKGPACSSFTNPIVHLLDGMSVGIEIFINRF